MTKKRKLESYGSKSPGASPDHKIVKLIFIDPAQFDTRFDDPEEPVECETVGWLTEQGQKCVKLTWLVSKEDQGDSTGLVLPRGCIKQIRILRAQAPSS